MSDEISFRSFGSVLKKVIDNRGRTCPITDHGVPLIATNCVTNNHLYPQFEKVRYVSADVMQAWFRGHPEPGDMIFVLKGTPGRVAWVPNPVGFCIAQDMVAIRADEKQIYPKYLFSVLRSKTTQQEIEGLHVGSLIPHFKKGDFDDLQIPIVGDELQKFIGDQYFDISSKIDLLHRQNKTLESMAETLFRQWFIEEAKEDWKTTTIGDLLDTVLGGTPSTTKPEFWNGTIPWINSGEVNKFRIVDASKFITELGLRMSNTKMLPKGTTVVAITGATLGQVSLLEIETCANQSVVGIIPNEVLPKEYVFLWIKAKISTIILSETGGAQPHINKNDINETEIVIPPVEVLSEKIKVFEDWFSKISSNVFQIRTLEKLRDNLLPKLMSGEVRVEV